MEKESLSKAWEFEAIFKESKNKIKSWFYADSKEDAKNRIEDYMEATIISLEEIEKPKYVYNKTNKTTKKNKI